MARAREVVAGKARMEGRSLAEWVPEMVRVVVAACDPVEVVEEDLKAVLVVAGEDPQTHNLLRRNALAEPPVFEGADLDVLGRLSDWAITQRYPADQPDPGPDDVAEALASGPRALAAIEARLAQGGG